jgi:hypothetical protein
VAAASLALVLGTAVPLLAADAATRTIPTFAQDVAPILQEKCQQCHQPNSIAPMSLITYQDVRPWARAIKERVATRQMPPWHIDPSVGVQEFKNDMSLSQSQIDTIVAWVDAGAPLGNPADLPPPKPLDDGEGWRAERDGYGAPDLVIRSPSYTMPARQQDTWYRPTSELPLTESRWVRLVEMRPSTRGGRRIMHHAIAYLVLNDDPDAVSRGTTSGGTRRDLQDALVNRRPQLMEWAIGKSYDLYRPDTGKLLLPGEQISWDMHIHAVGEEITSGVELGIWFYPKGQEPRKRSYLIGFTAIDRAKGLDIPPNSVTLSEGFTVLKENTLITNFQPHFHLRGRAMAVEAILPTGERQVISYVGHFNFNWMTNYIYADDAAPAFPRGTLIHVSAWYDNTRANPNNPDPEQWVGYGDRTVDEMGHAWMNVVYLTDAEYEAWRAEHKQAASKPRR